METEKIIFLKDEIIIILAEVITIKILSYFLSVILQSSSHEGYLCGKQVIPERHAIGPEGLETFFSPLFLSGPE